MPSAGLILTILLFTDMREASRRLSQSLFDVYEGDWAGEADLGAIVEVSGIGKGDKSCTVHLNITSAGNSRFHLFSGDRNPLFLLLLYIINAVFMMGLLMKGEDLLWNDYEVKILDQAVRTMESYVGQFPDVRVRNERVRMQNMENRSQKKHTKQSSLVAGTHISAHSDVNMNIF